MQRSNLIHGNTVLHLRAFFFRTARGRGEHMVEARVLVSRSDSPQHNQVSNHSDAFGFVFPLSHLFTYQLRQVQVQEMLSFVDHPDHHDVQFWNCHISAFALQAARVAILEGHGGFFMDVGIGIRMVDRNPWPVFEGSAELVDESLILSSDGEFGESEAVNEIMMISLEESVGGRGEFGGVPASKSSVSALETRRFEGVQGHESSSSSSSTSSASACVVCLEDFQAGVEVTAMPCSHEFHCTCLDKWFERSHLHPLCRFPMPTADSLVSPHANCRLNYEAPPTHPSPPPPPTPSLSEFVFV